MTEYRAPKFMLTDFNCPFCDVNARQIWSHYRWALGFFKEKLREITDMERSLIREHNKTKIDVLSTSFCQNCKKSSVWLNETLIYP